MIGFLRWWVMLPWGDDIPSQEGGIQFWSDCATIVQLIEEGECRLEAQWRRTAASPGLSDMEMLLREWPKLDAKWIRGHADRQVRAGTELFIIQKKIIAADALVDLSRSRYARMFSHTCTRDRSSGRWRKWGDSRRARSRAT